MPHEETADAPSVAPVAKTCPVCETRPSVNGGRCIRCRGESMTDDLDGSL